MCPVFELQLVRRDIPSKALKRRNDVMPKVRPMHTIYLGSRHGGPFLLQDRDRVKEIVAKDFLSFTVLDGEGFFAGKFVRTLVIKIASDDIDKVRGIVNKVGRGTGQKVVGWEIGGSYKDVMAIPPSHAVAI